MSWCDPSVQPRYCLDPMCEKCGPHRPHFEQAVLGLVEEDFLAGGAEHEDFPVAGESPPVESGEVPARPPKTTSPEYDKWADAVTEALAKLRDCEQVLDLFLYADRSRGYPTGQEWMQLIGLAKAYRKKWEGT